MATLRGTKSFYDYEFTDIIGDNLKTFFDYGLIEMGAYTPITYANPNTSGYTTLQRVYNDKYGGLGRTYEGIGPAWIWESGVSIIPSGLDQPFRPSGIRVNGTFYPTASTSGTYAHYIDYRHGRVIFNNSISGTVQCEYTIKDVGIYLTDEPEWKTIVNAYLDRYSSLGTLSPSGMASILKEARVWFPSVFIEVKDRSNEPLQLGGGFTSKYLVLFHIFGDKTFAVKRLSDTILNQEDKTLNLYDSNTAPNSLNFDGSLASGAMTYPQLSDRSNGYFITFGDIMSAQGGPKQSNVDFFRAECKFAVEVPRYLSTI